MAKRQAKSKAKKRVRLRDLKVKTGGSANIRGGVAKKYPMDAPKKGGQPAPTPTPSPTPTPTTTPTPS